MAQHIIGIDASATAVRVAVIEASLRRARLRWVQTISLAPDLAPSQLWHQVCQQIPKPWDAVVVGLDVGAVSSRFLTFPFGDIRKIEHAVDFELESQIPYALEEMASAWWVTDRQAHETQLMAAVTLKAPLVQHIEALANAGLEPRAVVLPAVALAEYVPPSAQEPSTAVVALGARQSHVAVVRKGLRLVRSMRAGGEDIDRVVAERCNLSLAQAKHVKETTARLLMTPSEAADPAQAQLSEALAQGLLPLIRDVVTTFKTLPTADQPQRIWITGGLSQLPGLPAFLQSHLGVKVEPLAVQELMGYGGTGYGGDGWDQVAPEHTVALGMAMALYRQGRNIPFNFRRRQLAYHGDLQLYRGHLTRLAMGMAAVCTLAICGSVVRYSMLRAEEHQLDQGFCKATQRIVGRQICDPTAALATLKQAPGSEGTLIPSFSASSLLEMLSKAISPAVDVQFDELELRVDALPGQPERVLGKGEAASFEATEQLVSMLKRDACVQDAEVSKLRKASQAGRVEFHMQVKVACAPGVQPGASASVQARQAHGVPSGGSVGYP